MKFMNLDTTSSTNITIIDTTSGADITMEFYGGPEIDWDREHEAWVRSNGSDFDFDYMVDQAMDLKYGRGDHYADTHNPDDIGVYVDDEERVDPDMDLSELQSIASNLYDGGWRADDREEIAGEYHLDNRNLDRVCELLKEYEEE